MLPIDFSQSNKMLTKPGSMTDAECQPMRVYTDGHICISLWKANWLERIKFFVTGKVWIWVHSGQTQPPIAADMKYPFVKRGK